MLADPSLLHTAITALLVHIMIGSLAWMFIYCSGRLVRIYATELTSSGSAADFLGNVLITVILIALWPMMLIAIAKGKLR